MFGNVQRTNQRGGRSLGVSKPRTALGLIETMNCIIRPLELEDEPFLWEMLYQAIYVAEGQTPLPREIVQIPELARYVRGWGREADCGFLSSDLLSNQPIGAVWLRFAIGNPKGYGYVDDNTAELSIAILPEHQGQ